MPAFTLVELLVVIGIIALLLSILLPSLSKATERGRMISCASNMRQVGFALTEYQSSNRGFLFPVGPKNAAGEFTTFGSNEPPHRRWPVYVEYFGIEFPDPMPYDVNLPYADDPSWTPETDPYDPYPFTTDILRCPEDPMPACGISFVLNQHLAYEEVKAGDTPAYKTASDIVLMGEKVTGERDLYMERSEFDRPLVELYRHGIELGSNYLYMDNSVSTSPPEAAKDALDPWALAGS
ncbi:MAG: type II secretion system protein [Phycisphaerae bacterium]